MNEYVAIYKGKKISIDANSSYEAQTKAGEEFKLKKNKHYQINLILVTVNKVPVIHDTAGI